VVNTLSGKLLTKSATKISPHTVNVTMHRLVKYLAPFRRAVTDSMRWRFQQSITASLQQLKPDLHFLD